MSPTAPDLFLQCCGQREQNGRILGCVLEVSRTEFPGPISSLHLLRHRLAQIALDDPVEPEVTLGLLVRARFQQPGGDHRIEDTSTGRRRNTCRHEEPEVERCVMRDDARDGCQYVVERLNGHGVDIDNVDSVRSRQSNRPQAVLERIESGRFRVECKVRCGEERRQYGIEVVLVRNYRD